MKNRLIGNYATTILGVLMCGSAVVMYYLTKPIEECAILFGWGLTFLRSKDSLIGLTSAEEEEN